MKKVIHLLVFLLVFIDAKAQNLETKSVSLDNFISFIADNFPLESTNKEDKNEDKNEDKITGHQIVFLLETTKKNFSSEDEIILKQAFKFLSNRLTEDDTISIVLYSGQNGLLLDSESPKEIKKVLHALNNVKDNLIENYDDGISQAYNFANNNFDEEVNNTVIMVRNPDAKEEVKTKSLNNDTVTQLEAKTSKNKNGSLVWLTAISLLPELIQVIKD